MRSKRGGTLAVEEIVKLVIGIGVFIFILFILFALGKIVTSNLKEEQAKNTLDNIVYEIGKLQNGEKSSVIIESPVKWMLVSNESKLCFCEQRIMGYWNAQVRKEEFISKCLSQNICYDFKKKVNVTSYCNAGQTSEGSFWVSREIAWLKTVPNCFYIDSVPKNIYIFKGVDEFFFGSSPGSTSLFNSSGWDGKYIVHVVKQDETLGDIASRYRVNLEDILILEKQKGIFAKYLSEGYVRDANAIQVGQEIRIPIYPSK